MRDVISQHGGFIKEDKPIRYKLAYESFMKAEKNTFECDGKTWTRSGKQVLCMSQSSAAVEVEDADPEN